MGLPEPAYVPCSHDSPKTQAEDFAADVRVQATGNHFPDNPGKICECAKASWEPREGAELRYVTEYVDEETGLYVVVYEADICESLSSYTRTHLVYFTFKEY